jgi:hypothetical protein
MTFRFIELQAFTEEVLRVADEESLREFQMELAANPESGTLIQQSGGLRKARFRLPGRGKSGGARVIYLWLPNRGIFVLFMLYTKSARITISAAQLSRLRSAVESIKTQYNR